jgi:hypothetical protein
MPWRFLASDTAIHFRAKTKRPGSHCSCHLIHELANPSSLRRSLLLIHAVQCSCLPGKVLDQPVNGSTRCTPDLGSELSIIGIDREIHLARGLALEPVPSVDDF